MADSGYGLENVVLTRLLRLNATVQGFVTGIVAGLGIFGVTNWLILTSKDGEVVGPHLALLGQLFIGYTVTLGGSLIGFVYAFIAGFVVGYGVTAMYNYIVEVRERNRASRA